MRREYHETQERLITATDALLDELPADEITVPKILERAGAARSSLYYFFEDLNDLLEEAYLRRFAAITEDTIRALTVAIGESTTSDELFARLDAITRLSQAQGNRDRRIERARMIARVQNNDRFRRRIGELQASLTSQIAELVSGAQERGLVTTAVSALGVATFVQAYAFGRLLDDVSSEPMPDEDWVATVGHVVRRAFAPG